MARYTMYAIQLPTGKCAKVHSRPDRYVEDCYDFSTHYSTETTARIARTKLDIRQGAIVAVDDNDERTLRVVCPPLVPAHA